DGDAALLEYCEKLRAGIADQNALREPIRVLLDARPGKAAAKRWDWVRKGAPVIIEVGPRDMDAGKVSLLRRDRLWNEAAKPDFAAPTLDEALAGISGMLEDVQASLFSEAKARRDGNISQIDSFSALEEFFAADKRYPGWAEVKWAGPSGAELEDVGEKLKALKLTLRNIPMEGAPADGSCIFTGRPATERIYVARAY